MCLRRIFGKGKALIKSFLKKAKAFFVDWLPNRGWRFLVGLATTLWAIGVIINPFVVLILTAIWTIFVAIITWSYYRLKRAAEIGVDAGQWTLRSMAQQFKDWREGRRRRKAHAREQVYGE